MCQTAIDIKTLFTQVKSKIISYLPAVWTGFAAAHNGNLCLKQGIRSTLTKNDWWLICIRMQLLRIMRVTVQQNKIAILLDLLQTTLKFLLGFGKRKFF